MARTLESEWNDKLNEVVRLEREHGEVREREKLELGSADRARILALARDLPSVWNAETTTHAERKNLLRMLVREVSLTPIDVPQRLTRIQMLWRTGAVSDFTVPRLGVGKYIALTTPPEALELVRELFAMSKTDAEIAAELNRRGLRTGARRAWNESGVRLVRYDHDLYRPSPNVLRLSEAFDECERVEHHMRRAVAEGALERGSERRFRTPRNDRCRLSRASRHSRRASERPRS